MNIKMIHIKENIKEKDFPEYIAGKDYGCLRFIQKNMPKIRDLSKGEVYEFVEIGKPDFFIWKGNKWWLCEFKSETDFLSTNQLAWLSNHKLPKAIAFVNLNQQYIPKEISLEERYQNQQMKKYHSVLNYILNRYMEKYPQTYGLFPNPSGGWCGRIPLEVSEQWKKVDKDFKEGKIDLWFTRIKSQKPDWDKILYLKDFEENM